MKLTYRRRDAVAPHSHHLGAAHQVAEAADCQVQGHGLADEGEVALLHPPDALLHAGHQRLAPLHVGVDAAVHWVLGGLWEVQHQTPASNKHALLPVTWVERWDLSPDAPVPPSEQRSIIVKRFIIFYIYLLFTDMVKVFWVYPEESERGASIDGAVLNGVLLGQVLEALDAEVAVIRLQPRIHPAEVGGQQHYGEQPPDGADEAAREGLRVRASSWE